MYSILSPSFLLFSLHVMFVLVYTATPSQLVVLSDRRRRYRGNFQYDLKIFFGTSPHIITSHHSHILIKIEIINSTLQMQNGQPKCTIIVIENNGKIIIKTNNNKPSLIMNIGSQTNINLNRKQILCVVAIVQQVKCLLIRRKATVNTTDIKTKLWNEYFFGDSLSDDFQQKL